VSDGYQSGREILRLSAQLSQSLVIEGSIREAAPSQFVFIGCDLENPAK
jgi:hypothetical protein